MKKNIIKSVVVLGFSATLLCGSCACGQAYTSYQHEKAERAYLLDFIHYCQGNEGLKQINLHKDYKKSSTHDLKNVARFYLEQDDFADVTDYWDVSVIDGIVYPQTDGRVIYNNK